MAKDTAEKAKESALSSPDVGISKKESDKADKAKKADAKPKEKKVNVLKKVGRFFKDVRSEFKKIVWPSKKQIINNTLVVVAVMLVVAVVAWLLDFAFLEGFRWLFTK